MIQEKFKIGQMYFISGYHDVERIYPCTIKPVIYIGKREKNKQKNHNGHETYAFEDVESWFKRKGKGKPNPKKMEYVEGPHDMTLVKDIGQLIEDLIRLRSKIA